MQRRYDPARSFEDQRIADNIDPTDERGVARCNGATPLTYVRYEQRYQPTLKRWLWAGCRLRRNDEIRMTNEEFAAECRA